MESRRDQSLPFRNRRRLQGEGQTAVEILSGGERGWGRMVYSESTIQWIKIELQRVYADNINICMNKIIPAPRRNSKGSKSGYETRDLVDLDLEAGPGREGLVCTSSIFRFLPFALLVAVVLVDAWRPIGYPGSSMI